MRSILVLGLNEYEKENKKKGKSQAKLKSLDDSYIDNLWSQHIGNVYLLKMLTITLVLVSFP